MARVKMSDEERKEKQRAHGKAWRAANLEKARAARRARYAANPEKERRTNAAWAKANSEKRRASNALRRKENPAAVKASQKKYREANREKMHAASRERYRTNSEKLRERAAAWRTANPEKVRATKAVWAKTNPEKVKAGLLRWRRSKGCVYYQQRYTTNIQHKLGVVLRSRVRHSLKNVARSGSAVRDLGCSIEELRIHLEAQFRPGMTWDNWSTDGWHIDHIVPLAMFDLTDTEQFRKACHYTNLQPLWAAENLSKGARFISTGA